MNKKTLLSIIVALIFVGGGAFYFISSSKETKNNSPVVDSVETDAQKFKKEYPGVADNNIFVYKTAEEIINLLEKGNGLIYLGFPECSWCQKYVIYLDEVAREQNVSQIAYFNVREIRTNNTAEYQKMVELMQAHLDVNDENEPRIFVPDVTAVQGSKIVGHDNTTSLNTSDDGTPNEWWTEERVNQLKNTLREMIRQASLCVDVCNI